jgi:hypothetical protein
MWELIFGMIILTAITALVLSVAVAGMFGDM